MDEKEIQRRQHLLRLFGYDASGDWDSEQEKAWLELITHLKQYQPTLRGFLSATWDKLTGNDTYLQEPEWQGEIKSDDRTEFARNLDYMASHNDNPIGYVWQTVAPAAEIAGSIVAAPKAIAQISKVVRSASIPTFLKSVRTVGYPIAGGFATSMGVNLVSKATTGKSWEENTSPYTGYTFNFLADPVSLSNPVSYPIFYKQSKNLLDLGRYTMDVLSPASYSWKGAFKAAQAIATAMNPFTKPPKFNDRKPKGIKIILV